jgi:hypothetical protein
VDGLFIILIILAAIFALIQAFRVKDKFARIINVVVSVAIGVSLIPVKAIAIDGSYLFLIGCLLVMLFAFSDNSFGNLKKSVLITIGGIQLVSHLFWLQQWPGMEYLLWSCFISVALYIFVVTKEIREYQIEIGFLTVLMVDALIKGMMVLSASGAADQG